MAPSVHLGLFLWTKVVGDFIFLVLGNPRPAVSLCSLSTSFASQRSRAVRDGIGAAVTDENGPVFRGVCTSFVRKSTSATPSV